MKKVKITVLRATFNEDLALEYGMSGLKPCSVMKQGQVFYAAHAKPDGFCDGAWRTIYQYVFALANGARSFYYNDWIRQPGVAIACCNDGLRPVFFKLEATDGKMVGGTFARTNGMAHDVFRSVRRSVERRSGPGRPASENGGPAVWTVRRFSRGYDGRRPSGRCDGGSVAQVREAWRRWPDWKRSA